MGLVASVCQPSTLRMLVKVTGLLSDVQLLPEGIKWSCNTNHCERP